jgi:hypothetical protein
VTSAVTSIVEFRQNEATLPLFALICSGVDALVLVFVWKHNHSTHQKRFGEWTDLSSARAAALLANNLSAESELIQFDGWTHVNWPFALSRKAVFSRQMRLMLLCGSHFTEFGSGSLGKRMAMLGLPNFGSI